MLRYKCAKALKLKTKLLHFLYLNVAEHVLDNFRKNNCLEGISSESSLRAFTFFEKQIEQILESYTKHF